MAFADSPFLRIRTAGPRILQIRTELLAVAWNMAPIDALLKAILSEAGTGSVGVVLLPNGATETEDAMQIVFESRSHVLEEVLQLYENEFKQMAPLNP